MAHSAHAINVITKSYGAFQVEVDEELQKTNPLAGRGIFLVEVPDGVVWGYDSKYYVYDESNQILRKGLNKTPSLPKPFNEQDKPTEKRST